MTRREMLSKLDSYEITEWMQYDQIDPIGREREDWHAGMIASMVANVMTGKKGKKYKPQDFMPKFERKQSSWQSQLKMVEMMNKAFGGKDLRGS